MKKLCCIVLGKKAADSEAETTASSAPEQQSIALIQLPQPAKLSGGNYDLEHWLTRNNTNSSFASSRSNARTPDSFFLPDPVGVEYVSDPEDEIQAPKPSGGALGTARKRLSRRLSQGDNKRASTGEPKPVPTITPEEKRKREQDAYRAEVRRNSRARLQAEVRSENNSSRSVSTRGSNRFRELETVVEDPNDRCDSLRSGPRDNIEFSVVTGNSVAGIDYHLPLSRPKAARLPPATIKYDPTDYDNEYRRRRGYPRSETSPKVMASQIVLRERGSLPLMPPPPVLLAQRSSDDQDDDSFKTWRLSQCIDHGSSQNSFSTYSEKASIGPAQVTNVVDTKNVSKEGIPLGIIVNKQVTQGNLQPSENLEIDRASNNHRASESSQSQEGNDWGVWLLAQELASQDNNFATNEDHTETEPVSRLANYDDAPNDMVLRSPSHTTLPRLGTSGDLTIKSPASPRFSHMDLQSTLALNLEMEDKMDRVICEIEVEDLRNQQQAAESSSHGTATGNQEASGLKALDAKAIGQDDSYQLHITCEHDEETINPAMKTIVTPEAALTPGQPQYPSSGVNAHYILETFKDLDLPPFNSFDHFRQERSDESYRTTLSLVPSSEVVVTPVGHIVDKTLSANISSIKSKDARKSGTALMGQGIRKSKSSLSLTPPKSQQKLGILGVEISDDPPNRKSSFIQALLQRTASGSKGHRKSQSQPSAMLAPFNTSSESLRASKPLGHVKKLSNLSTTPRVQAPSATEDFTAPKLTESVTAVWKRAIQQEKEQRNKSTASGSSFRLSKGSISEHTLPRAEPISTDNHNCNIPGSTVPPNSSALVTSDTKSAPQKLATPPASWAKWASHTRAERTAAAGPADNVIPKDFAASATVSEKQTWVTDKTSVEQEMETQQTPQSLSKRLGKAVKAGLNKMAQSKPKSKQPDQLEYPELEILPTKEGYKDLKALEKSIEAMKVSQRAKMATNPALAIAEMEKESKNSLGKALAVQIQEAEHAKRDQATKTDHITDCDKGAAESGNGGLSNRPVTPANRAISQIGDTTATTENWATPVSRLSNSPCDRATENHNSEMVENSFVSASESAKKTVLRA
nr:uncharacterized protein CTRU02_08948 [Colletotrichum truncatum]KAF6789156.1 hypothetical protein CTRU02_08948 [Colletotrichum truncatum]